MPTEQEIQQQYQQMQQYQGVSSFYQSLSKEIFHGESERTFIDKLLGRQDADKLHELIKKEPLTLSDVEEILFLMTSIDQKLLNYNEWDRYVIVKLFPWIKDFSIICKIWMIYTEEYRKGKFDAEFKKIGTEKKDEEKKIHEEIKEYILQRLRVKDIKIKDVENIDNTIKEITAQVLIDEQDKIITLTEIEQKFRDELVRIVEEINKYLLHYLKYLISTFLLLSNTTLSINGAAFDSMITSKFEYSYPAPSLPQPQERRSIFNVFKSKR